MLSANQRTEGGVESGRFAMGAQVVRHARLYESAPAYITDQPQFLNTAIAAKTRLPPDQLLSALKAVEVAHKPLSIIALFSLCRVVCSIRLSPGVGRI